MSDTVIKVEDVGKLYRLGEVGTGSLSRDLRRWWDLTRGKEDPFATIGETNDRTIKGESEYVWALKNINFELKQGEVLGVIGKNGAGKSTLLKLLSKVTTPTTGTIKIKGRIASLLEVGTGFHPDLTGKENIFLNGAILGMTKKEIRRKLDEIVDFSGVQRYVETPVKRYSSGMYVRLAFAVAAHLESEVLIVDEVLAVGDVEFQKKCLGKMNEVSKDEGRTILFVSHNMAAIKNLCSSSVVLENGQVKFAGSVNGGIENYLQNSSQVNSSDLEAIKDRSGTKKVLFSSFHIENENGQVLDMVLTGDNIVFVFRLRINDKTAQKIDLGFSIHDSFDEIQSYLYSSFQDKYYTATGADSGYLTVRCQLKDFPFSRGSLKIKGRILVDETESDWPKDDLGSINIQQGDFFKTGKITDINTAFLIKGQWH